MTELGRRIGIRLGSVQKYLALNRAPAEQIIPIERASSGKVTRYMLGPDLSPRCTSAREQTYA
jgi:DNA-binding transcriptional regulator YdaS (Cro superfamily)